MRNSLSTHGSILAISITGLTACLPTSALAQHIAPQDVLTQDIETIDPTATDVVAAASEVAYLRNQVRDLQAKEAAARQTVEALEARLSRLEQIKADPISPEDAAIIRGRYMPEQNYARPSDPAFGGILSSTGTSSNQLISVQTRQDASEDSVSGSDRKAPAPTVAQEDVSEQQQGTFGRRFSVEVGASYTRFGNARINLDGFLALDAIFLGTISIDQINADIFTLEPSFDLGLTDRLFIDTTVPFLSRTSNFQSGGAGGSAAGLVERTVHGTGIGDVSAGLSYRLFPETVNLPDVVINARVKIPTGRHPFGIEFVEVQGSEGNLQIPEHLSFGTGVYGASLGWSMLKTLDPMIVFGSATYFRNFKRSFDDINEIPGDQPGEVKLGDAFQYGAGLAFALNDKSSISMSYTQRIVERTRLTPEGQDGRIVVGSQANVALMNIGATFSLGENISLVSNVGVGLTDDSPDVALSVRVPYRF